MVDGCVDAYADDVMACGARCIISEPYTDYKALARRYKNCFLAEVYTSVGSSAGLGDQNRIGGIGMHLSLGGV
jgi:hypothetical protein